MTDAWHWKRLGEPYDAHGGIDDVVPALDKREALNAALVRLLSIPGVVLLDGSPEVMREFGGVGVDRCPAALAPDGATIAAEAEGQGASAHDRRDGAVERNGGGVQSC